MKGFAKSPGKAIYLQMVGQAGHMGKAAIAMHQQLMKYFYLSTGGLANGSGHANNWKIGNFKESALKEVVLGKRAHATTLQEARCNQQVRERSNWLELPISPIVGKQNSATDPTIDYRAARI